METRLSGAMEMQAVSGGTGAHAACSEDGETFSEPLSAGRAYVFGGGHVSRALCPLLARTGFCVTVLDDREDVLTESAFPDAEARIVGPLAQSAARISLEPNDFVVVMTHGHHLDYEVLRETLRQPLAYVGMIGSKKKIGAISARLIADGIPQERIDSVHMPIGLAIGAETPLRPLSWKEVYLRGLELCAQAMAFREDAIYDPDVLTARMLNFARTGEGVEAMDGRDVLKYAEMGSRELISYLYRALRTLGDFPAECVGCLSEFPAETAAALYLSCAEKEVN